jgi:hypothetical protein
MKGELFYIFKRLLINEYRTRGIIPSYPMEDCYVQIEEYIIHYNESISHKGYFFFYNSFAYILSPKGLWIFDREKHKDPQSFDDTGRADITGINDSLNYLKENLSRKKYHEIEQYLFQLV